MLSTSKIESKSDNLEKVIGADFSDICIVGKLEISSYDPIIQNLKSLKNNINIYLI